MPKAVLYSTPNISIVEYDKTIQFLYVHAGPNGLQALNMVLASFERFAEMLVGTFRSGREVAVPYPKASRKRLASATNKGILSDKHTVRMVWCVNLFPRVSEALNIIQTEHSRPTGADQMRVY